MCMTLKTELDFPKLQHPYVYDRLLHPIMRGSSSIKSDCSSSSPLSPRRQGLTAAHVLLFWRDMRIP